MAEKGIKREFLIADVAAHELAHLFCEMYADEQAAFFSEVGRIAAQWPGTGWCQQSCGISEHLDKRATETILKLAEWAADPYTAAALEAQAARIAALEGELAAAREALEAIAKPLTGNRYPGHQFKWAQDIAIRVLSGERP
jgi:hypothetical protein